MNTNTSIPSPSLEPWQEQLNLRISKFADVLGLPCNQVKEMLRELGIKEEKESSLTILDDETLLTMSDLFEKFVDTKLTDKPTLRLAVSFLRAKSKNNEFVSLNATSPIDKLVSALRPKDQWSDEELLEAYKEEDPDIAAILSRRSNGRAFIIFDNDGNVNIAESLKMLKLAKKQPTNETHMILNVIKGKEEPVSKLVKLYRSGKYPARALDECPFCPGKVLVDNYCADTDTVWQDISHQCRVLAAIQFRIVEKGRQLTIDQYQSIIKDKNFDAMCQRFKKAALLYEELKEQDKLPTLKIYPQNGNKVDTGF